MNLSNCSSKVVLENWEQRRDFCPWCSAAQGTSNGIDLRFHRLIGNDRNPSTSGRGYLPRTSQWESSASDADDDEMENSTATKRLSEKRAKQRERSVEQRRALAAYLPREQANLTQEQAMLTVGKNDPLPSQQSVRDVVKELVKKGRGVGKLVKLIRPPEQG